MHSSEMGRSGTIQMLRWFTYAGLLIPTLLFAGAAWKDRAAILDAAEDDGAKMVALVHEQAVNLFTGHEIILNMIVDRMRDRDWSTVEDPTEILHELEAIDLRLDRTSEIVVVDATGALHATTVHPQANEPPPTADEGCFLALSRNQVELCISRPPSNAGPEHNVFSVSRRLEKDGVFNGIAQVGISAGYLAGLWASATPSASDIVAMVTSDGTILAQSRPQLNVEPEATDLGKTLVDQMDHNDTGIIRAPLSPSGIDRITIYAKDADHPVSVALSLDRTAVLAIWRANLAVYGLVAATATAGILLALGIALRRAKKERQAVSLWRAEIEERELAQEQLRQSQKMESLGKLTGGIAHDFNNLLTAIIGNISLAQDFAQDVRLQRFLDNALKTSNSAASLTQRLTAFARKQVLNPRSIDLMSLVNGMQDLLEHTLGPDVRLTVSSDPLLWPALVDPNQIEMTILNLAINASDAMPRGGTLTIDATNAQFASDGPPGLAPGQYVVLTVSDSGTGMDEATLERAMEPFFTTKEPGKGTGLGLSMMQGVVSQSGGATRLHSEPGRGTQIEIWLPRAQLPPEETANRDAHMDHQDEGAVVVCDDDPAVLELLCDILSTKGYEVVSVTNGRAALSALTRNRSIRLLVVDLTMPEMNGGVVAREARIGHPHIPILIITGNANVEAIKADLPGVALLCKPFTPKQFTARIADLLETG